MKIGWAPYNMLLDIYVVLLSPQKWFHNNELMKIGPDGVQIFSKITWTWIMELNTRIAFCTFNVEQYYAYECVCVCNLCMMLDTNFLNHLKTLQISQCKDILVIIMIFIIHTPTDTRNNVGSWTNMIYHNLGYHQSVHLIY